MPVHIYKLTRVGGSAVRFLGKDGTDFTDPAGLNNPQISRIIGKRLSAYVRCEVGGGTAEILGEATPEEIAAHEGTNLSMENEQEDQGPASFKFPG